MSYAVGFLIRICILGRVNSVVLGRLRQHVNDVGCKKEHDADGDETPALTCDRHRDFLVSNRSSLRFAASQIASAIARTGLDSHRQAMQQCQGRNMARSPQSYIMGPPCQERDYAPRRALQE